MLNEIHGAKSRVDVAFGSQAVILAAGISGRVCPREQTSSRSAQFVGMGQLPISRFNGVLGTVSPDHCNRNASLQGSLSKGKSIDDSPGPESLRCHAAT